MTKLEELEAALDAAEAAVLEADYYHLDDATFEAARSAVFAAKAALDACHNLLKEYRVGGR